MGMPVKRISCSAFQIFFLKRAFPALWFGILALFVMIGLLVRPTPNALSIPFLVFPIVMAVFGYFIMKKTLFNLADEVTDAGDCLVVRFGAAQERIALTNIMNVSYTVMANPPRVTLALREPCRFGKDVSFSPPARLVPFSKSPIINELIDRLEVARRNSLTNPR